ncbi:MAG: S-methyl-5'-thioadenosine phosphorylase, partial [Bacillota bacterium]|nr:S-methyl-5'-thioadenosine phosphorylase [Bacillota bacterium]
MTALALIGGTGVYRADILEDPVAREVVTPYGKVELWEGRLQGTERQAIFLTRHGQDHGIPPHRIPYRAILWALKETGVERFGRPLASAGEAPYAAPIRFDREAAP